MFLHLGNNYMIQKEKVIAILDLETTRNSTITKTFYQQLQKKEQVENVGQKGKEKSFVITSNGYYLSPISSATLLKRSIDKGV